MKILHIVPSYKPAYIYGGPIESVSKLCEGLAAAGHHVDVFTTRANGAEELDVKPGVWFDVDGVRVTYFHRITKDPTHVSPSLWLHLYLNARSYDVVNIQSWWNILVIIAVCICYLRGVKVVVSPRGMLSGYIFRSGSSRAKKMIHKVIGKWALSKSYFHATAQSEYEECLEVIPCWKGFVQPNIITLPDIPVLKHSNSRFTLIFMSRIHPKKGIEILFHAVAKLQFPVQLQIAGSGDEDYIQELKALAVELDIQSKIVWLGWLNRESKFKALMDADLFVLASLNENFANVVIESLHMGTPVMISENVALSSFIKEQDMGWVSTLEADDVAEKIAMAYHDDLKMELINVNGREVIEEHFSAERLVSAYAVEYQKIIDDKN